MERGGCAQRGHACVAPRPAWLHWHLIGGSDLNNGPEHVLWWCRVPEWPRSGCARPRGAATTPTTAAPKLIAMDDDEVLRGPPPPRTRFTATDPRGLCIFNRGDGGAAARVQTPPSGPPLSLPPLQRAAVSLGRRWGRPALVVVAPCTACWACLGLPSAGSGAGARNRLQAEIDSFR